MTECGWECRGLQLVMMLIDGLNLRPKVKSQDITVVIEALQLGQVNTYRVGRGTMEYKESKVVVYLVASGFVLEGI